MFHEAFWLPWQPKWKTFKNLLLPNRYLDGIIILQECSLDTGLQNSLKKNDLSKNMAFMGDSFSFYGIK